MAQTKKITLKKRGEMLRTIRTLESNSRAENATREEIQHYRNQIYSLREELGI